MPFLDALAKTLADRGCLVSVGKRSAYADTNEMIIKVGDDAIALEMEEQLDSKPHVLTAQERRDQAQRPWISFRSHDHFPSGRLTLRVAHGSHRYRKRSWWRDDGEHRLEDQLGRAVVAIEEVVYVVSIEESERKEEAHRRMLEERRRVRAQRLDRKSAHRGAIAAYLACGT